MDTTSFIKEYLFMDRNSCLNYFQAFPFWEHMTEEDQDFLLDNIRELHYPAGAAIQSEERQCLGTLFLLKGVLRVYLLSSQGKEATLYRFLYAFCHHI
jgi:CRP/FNR family transcriptional regulator